MKFTYQKYKDDSWSSEVGSILKYDKLEHFILGFIGYFVTRFFFGFWATLLIWEALGTGWEIKDGFITRFSPKDWVANNYGFLVAESLFQVSYYLYYVYQDIQGIF